MVFTSFQRGHCSARSCRRRWRTTAVSRPDVFPGDVHDGGAEALGASYREDDLIAAVDAPALAQELRDRLGPEGARLLGRRLKGATLVELATGSKVGISTAHERIAKAVEQVHVQVRRHRLVRESFEPVLEQLGG